VKVTNAMDETVDFVVVGAGGGSMCAGLVMRKAGKSVLVLEKTDLIGGSTARSGGVMWIPGNRFMTDRGTPDTDQAAAAYLASVTGDYPDMPAATAERQRAYIREAPEMLEFLLGEGLKLVGGEHWPDYYTDRPGGSELGRTVVAEVFDTNELGAWREKLRPSVLTMPLRTDQSPILMLVKTSWRARARAVKLACKVIGAKLTRKRLVSSGAALQGRMLQAALKAGVDVRTDSPVRRLIMEGDAVIGVVTEQDGREWRIGARLGVLLNAGGFAHNQEMRDRYIPNTRSEWSYAAPGDTGDMHRELMRIGAAMAQMGEMVGGQMTVTPTTGPEHIQMQMAKPHCLVVDQSGVRYQNESGSYMEFCKQLLARHQTVPALPSWMIMDTNFLRKYMLGETMPGLKKPAAWTEQGYLRKADSIAELARLCDLPEAALLGTVERFNGFAREGRDADFNRGGRGYDLWLGDYTHKPNAALGTIEKGPFYAVPVVPGDVGTYGGAVIDTSGRVLREDGSVIPGLYATGTTSASAMGGTYPGAGCSIGPSFTWGYAAAKHAAHVGNQNPAFLVAAEA
jgi:3-oxosteroid 1-dehydrogenase